jgi:glycosyltransferase involved in cell wall biosynthesis
MAMGQYPIEDIASCVRISSYAKLHFGAAGIDGAREQKELFNEQEMFKASKFIFGPSQNTIDFIKKDLNLERDIKIIETPFAKYEGEQDRFVYEKFLSGKSYVLFFGTLWALKGSVEIAEIIYDFLNRYKEMNFVFVGKQNKDKGNNSYPIDEILKNAKEHKDRVIHIDSQPHKTLYPIIENAKAVVLPSRYDNFPNTCIEAMSLKKVVLATKNTGFDQMIKDGANGFLCEAYNSKSLLEGLHRIMNAEDNEMRRLSQNAYERILDLEPSKAAARLLDYYRYVIENWRKYG